MAPIFFYNKYLLIQHVAMCSEVASLKLLSYFPGVIVLSPAYMRHQRMNR